MKKRYYAVRMGRRIGVFDEPWSKVKTYVDGYPGAIYKGFNDMETAWEWLRADKPNWAKKIGQKKTKRHNRCERLLTGFTTNPLGLKDFYSGDKAPWEFEEFIWCSEEARLNHWLFVNYNGLGILSMKG